MAPFLIFCQGESFSGAPALQDLHKRAHKDSFDGKKNTQAGKMGWIDLFDIGHCEFLHDDGASGVQ